MGVQSSDKDAVGVLSFDKDGAGVLTSDKDAAGVLSSEARDIAGERSSDEDAAGIRSSDGDAGEHFNVPFSLRRRLENSSILLYSHWRKHGSSVVLLNLFRLKFTLQ